VKPEPLECSVCGSEVDLEGEGGVSGYFGIIPVAFCVWCYSSILDKKAFSKILFEYTIRTFEEALACSELWNINNGETLCVECHKETDTYLKGNLCNG